MKRRNGTVDRAVSRVMDLDSPTYGDERERAVFMEASTFGIALGMYASLLVALVSALLGELLLPVVVLVTMAVPSWATIWYAGRKGVDVHELAQRAGTRSKAVNAGIVFGSVVLVLAAMTYTVSAGHGIVPVPEVDPASVAGRFADGMLNGALVGGFIGAVAGLVLLFRKSRRTRPGRDAGTDDD